MFARIPPHHVRWQDGTFSPLNGNDSSNSDYRALMAAPEIARQIYLEKRQSDAPLSDPCAWFDLESRQCRFYEFRPEACRNFEMGGEACRMLRQYSLG